MAATEQRLDATDKNEASHAHPAPGVSQSPQPRQIVPQSPLVARPKRFSFISSSLHACSESHRRHVLEEELHAQIEELLERLRVDRIYPDLHLFSGDHGAGVLRQHVRWGPCTESVCHA